MPRQPAADPFRMERSFLARGCRLLAGVDEAGRGPLAGPVMAAAVILPNRWITRGLPSDLEGLRDSKQLGPARREFFFHRFLKHQLPFAVAEIDAQTIDSINILRATHAAMNRALLDLDPPPDHALVDGLPVPGLTFPHTAIIKGDSQSCSIGAASIVAKVLRDQRMIELDRLHPGYGFAIHKGYPTPDHLDALHRLGPSPVHRRSFAPLRLVQSELFPTHAALVQHPASP